MTSSASFVLYGVNGQSEPIIIKETDGLSCVQGTTEDFEVGDFLFSKFLNNFHQVTKILILGRLLHLFVISS